MIITREIPFYARSQYRQAFNHASGCLKPTHNRPISEEGGYYSLYKIAHKQLPISLLGMNAVLDQEIPTTKIAKKPDLYLDPYLQRDWWGYGEFAGINSIIQFGYQTGHSPRSERKLEDAELFAACSYQIRNKTRRLTFNFNTEGKIIHLRYTGFYNDGTHFYDQVEFMPDGTPRLQISRRDRGDQIRTDNVILQYKYRVEKINGEFSLQRRWKGENLFAAEFAFDPKDDFYKSRTTIDEPRSIFHGVTAIAISENGGNMNGLQNNAFWQIHRLPQLTDVQLWDGSVTKEKQTPELYARRFEDIIQYMKSIEPLVHLDHGEDYDFVRIGVHE